VALEHRVALSELTPAELPTPAAPVAGAEDVAAAQRLDAATHRAAALACARAPTTAGLSPECRQFMKACSPQPTTWHHVYYYLGHAVVYGAILTILLAGAVAPIAAWVVGKWLVPGGRPVALALVAAGYAALWSFISSTH
jgi:hypothetical protein